MSSKSMPSKDRQEGKTKRFWITLSLLLSTAILVWSFSLPFRKPGGPLVSSSQSQPIADGQLELSEQIKQRRNNAEEFRDAAIALDQEFMRSLARRNQRKNDLPGIEQSRKGWNRYLDSVKKQLRQLKDAEVGTVEWQEKQRLLASLEDAPQQ